MKILTMVCLMLCMSFIFMRCDKEDNIAEMEHSILVVNDYTIDNKKLVLASFFAVSTKMDLRNKH